SQNSLIRSAECNLLLGEPSHAVDSDPEDDYRRRPGVVSESRFDGCEHWEGMQKSIDHIASFIWFHFLIRAKCERALPSNIALNLVNLQTCARILSQRIDF